MGLKAVEVGSCSGGRGWQCGGGRMSSDEKRSRTRSRDCWRSALAWDAVEVLVAQVAARGCCQELEGRGERPALSGVTAARKKDACGRR